MFFRSILILPTNHCLMPTLRGGRGVFYMDLVTQLGLSSQPSEMLLPVVAMVGGRCSVLGLSGHFTVAIGISSIASRVNWFGER